MKNNKDTTNQKSMQIPTNVAYKILLLNYNTDPKRNLLAFATTLIWFGGQVNWTPWT
jgi:hypothetical protein